MSYKFEVDINWLAVKGENKSDEKRDKIQLAALNLSGLKSADIDKIVDLLNSLKPKGDSH